MIMKLKVWWKYVKNTSWLCNNLQFVIWNHLVINVRAGGGGGGGGGDGAVVQSPYR